MQVAPVTLTGTHVRLEPLAQHHCTALQHAEADGNLSALWYTTIPDAAGMHAEIGRRLSLQEQGTMLPFAVLAMPGDRVMGMTTYLNIEPAERRLEIGATWYARAAQRTALNTEAKLLLLNHAFATLGCIAVELRTHSLNHQSRRAIERLGAKLDGILRHHRTLPNGTLRDTCVYSITAPDWPAVRANLQARLQE